MNFPSIILELQNTSSRLEKESIITREMLNGNGDFFTGVYLACNKLITFGVNEKSVQKKPDDCVENSLQFGEFLELCNKLISRDLSGNLAKDAIFSAMDKSSSYFWNNWYMRILLKDLKCGVDFKTINNCAEKNKLFNFLIPVFSCQLAQDSKNHNGKMCGNKIIQEKLDGTRVITIVTPGGKVEQFSRNGKELLNFKSIKDGFYSFANNIKVPMVFDGEVMSSSFQQLMTQLYRKTDIKTEDAILYLFDCIPLDDFISGICKTPQYKRLEILKEIVPLNISNIKILDYSIVNLDSEEGLKTFEIFNRFCIESGKEGVMIKEPNSFYECKRTSSWLKLKPEITVDLRVVDLQEGEDKYCGMLGAFVCNGFEEEKEIFVNVGSGFSDSERRLFWKKSEDIIGKIVEVKCDAITKNQNGTYSLRFPRFVRVRGFSSGEKI